MPKNHAAQVEPDKPVEKPESKPPNLNPFINEGKPADPLPPLPGYHRETDHG